jgi:hypothetical protein
MDQDSLSNELQVMALKTEEAILIKRQIEVEIFDCAFSWNEVNFQIFDKMVLYWELKVAQRDVCEYIEDLLISFLEDPSQQLRTESDSHWGMQQLQVGCSQ